MIKAFTLGLIMGAVIGTTFGVLIMACVQAGRDYYPPRNQRECPKFRRKQFRRVILPVEIKIQYRRFTAILERVRK